MAEVIGGAFLSAFFQSLFDRIDSDEIIGFFRGKKNFEGLLRKLKTSLLYVGAVLDDAEMKQLRNPRVKEWLEGLKDAVEDAENLLDEISTDALEKKIIGSESGSGVKGFFSRKTKMNEILGKLKIIDAESGTTCCTGFVKGVLDSRDRDRKARMEEIIGRLENFAGEKDVLGLEKGAGERLSRRVPSSSLDDESEIYGRNDDKDGVKKLVLSDGAKAVSVIPIVGMGGVGKTTLAQAVFNDDEVEKRFEVKAWVCVSEEFDVCKVTKNVLEEVTEKACGAMELNMLQVKLKEMLKGKRFLIVLDDVWNEKYEDWEALKKPFQDGADGSKIIVTTRSNDVASVMGSSPTHYLKILSDEDCWKLFAKHASGNEDFSKNPRLEGVGRQIANKCKGLPLAAKTLGGMLRSKLDVGEWERVLRCEIWDLAEGKSNILPALLVSYHYLPSHLKRCFAYCSMFPKEYKFVKEKLVLLWMAEGLLKMKDEGDEFFNDLVSRSFFQPSSTNYESKPCFVMHDLMVDLAKFVSGNCFQLGVDNSNEYMKKVRHVAYYRELYDSFTLFNHVSAATRLRTFLPLDKNWYGSHLPDKVVHDLIFNLKCLRSLSLSEYSNVRELPDLIGELKHLRYLDLSFTSITQLPESVCGLYNLQTLNLSGCGSLTRLPRYMHRLINLQHLHISESCIEMPASMSKLNNLRVLNIFIVGKDNETTIHELHELSKLRGSLCIKNLSNVANAKDASEAKLMDKKSLKELSLDWGYEDPNDSAHENLVLENLVPYTTLESLAINHYGGTSFPTWLGDHLYCNMVEMKLSKCKNCTSLPPLGQLVSLKTLTIEGFSAIETVDHGFYGNSASSSMKPFASLENLHFRDMSIWQDWLPMQATDVGLFPKLKHLELSGCPKFTGNLPDSFQSLAVLRIENCQQISCSLPSMPVVRELKLVDCENLLSPELPPTVQSLVIRGFKTLVSLSETLKVMENCLEELEIKSCPSLMTLGALPRALKTLEIRHCAKLEFPFPRSHESLNYLQIISSCDSMQCFQQNSFTNLGVLHLEHMKNLESLSVSASDGKCLYIDHCPSLASFPGGGFSAPKLSTIWITGSEKLKCLPEQMSTLFPHLKDLFIFHCPMIESFPQAGLPSDLHRLWITSCDQLVASRKNWNLTRLTKLDCFMISGSSEIRSFPDEGQLPATITRLYIDDLSSLETLDRNGLQELTSLKELKIVDCTNLHTVPVEGLPNSLRLLHIFRCPLLEETKLKMKIRECSKDISLVIK